MIYSLDRPYLLSSLSGMGSLKPFCSRCCACGRAVFIRKIRRYGGREGADLCIHRRLCPDLFGRRHLRPFCLWRICRLILLLISVVRLLSLAQGNYRIRPSI